MIGNISLHMWLYIIFGILGLGILLDGARRFRQHQRNPYRLSLGAGVNLDELSDDPLRHEFPRGGARPVDPRKIADLGIQETPIERKTQTVTKIPAKEEPIETTEKPVVAKKESFFSRKAKIKEPEAEKPVKQKKPTIKQEQLRFDESVPVLMESLGIKEQDSMSAEDEFDSDQDAEPLFPHDFTDSRAESKSSKSTISDDEAPPVEEVIAVNVLSRDASGFKGDQLLEVFLDSGLRYGDMSIFHRHQSPTGQGKVLFSVANAVNPGIFKLEAMDKMTTKGICFFFGLPGPNNPMDTFDLMLETAQYLAKRLNGDVKDDQRSVITIQTIEHYRHRIRDFERRYLVQ